MEDKDHNSKHSDDRPPVLALNCRFLTRMMEPLYSHKFNFIDVPPTPLDQFLTAQNLDPSSIRAVVTSVDPVTADMLRLLPSLGVLVIPATGTDHVDLEECRRRGIKATNAGRAFAEDVADFAVGLFIDVTRKLTAADRYVRSRLSHGASHFPLGSKVGGKRVGIVGLGNIGLEVAKRLKALGCIISYNSRTNKPFVPYPFYSNVVELAASCDALVICCAMNEQTRHIISKEVMLALGKEGVIVNVGRGALIDEKELVECLVKGEIGGAGLDVFEDEPRVPKELFDLDTVVLSPHTAAVTPDSSKNIVEVVGQNLEAFFSNKPLATPILID